MAVEPFHRDESFTLYVGDALETLKTLDDGCVQCCVTSPPYWGLRDYGVDGQLGLEGSPAEYVAAMVAVFTEVRRVLVDDGVLFLNLGDSYNNRNVSRQSSHQGGLGFESDDLSKSWADLTQEGRTRLSISDGDLKEKDLIGVPWMVAFALRADGWYLRSDIIWAKPNPMPESVTDRPTKAHEYVFLLSKSPRYFFDADAVREPYKYDGRTVTHVEGREGSEQHRNGERWPGLKPRKSGNLERKPNPASALGHGDTKHGIPWEEGIGRNIRSVWEIATEPYPDAHFATFPQALARRCILAGCPEWVCGTCGVPRTRLTDVTYEKSPVHGAGSVVGRHYETGSNNYDGAGMPRLNKRTETVGWSDCGHDNYQPGVVLDPFLGSGTVALVAKQERRHAVGIELNPEYAAMAVERCRIWWRKRDPKPPVVEDQMAMSSDELGA